MKTVLLLASILIIVAATITSCGKTGKTENAPAELAPPPPPPPVAEVPVPAEPEPYTVVEEMPQFKGGDKALLDYVGKNVVYPSDAKAKGTQGRVIVRFCVTEKGAVNKISIVQGVSPDIDAESIRVIGTLPAFKPGKQNGVAVPVWYTVPISFTLK